MERLTILAIPAHPGGVGVESGCATEMGETWQVVGAGNLVPARRWGVPSGVPFSHG